MKYIKWLLILVFVVAGCRPSPPTDYNVVIIGIDTCRKDHMSLYDYPYATTPELEKLAKESVIFHNAVSTSPWTLPSFASLFTACYPTVHGAYGQFNSAFHPIRKSVPNGVREMSRAGLKTQAFVNAPFLLPEFGFPRGFDDYDASRSDNAHIRRADATFSAAMEWAGAHKSKPFFLFIHLFDPHLNYDPPAGHLQRLQELTGLDYKGPLEVPFSHFKSIRSGEVVLTPEDWAYVKMLYDAEISFVDEWCGRFIAFLKEQGLYDKTMLVVCSDHGEEFMDHNGFEHGHTQYQELVNVPLIIKYPGSRDAGEHVHDPVSLVDIMPTVFDVLSLETPAEFQGKSLSPVPSRPVFSEHVLYGRETKAVVVYPWKLIAHYRFEKVELYNLQDDPAEKNDVHQQEPEIVDKLTDLIQIWIDQNLEYGQGNEGKKPAQLDKKTLEELKSLGYIK